LPKVNNTDICYKAVQFYLSEHPLLVNDLLLSVATRVDHGRVVALARKMQLLALIKDYMLAVQDRNITAVNDALNELYVEEDDFEGLRTSVDAYDNFDQIKLAQELEKHDLLEFRRVSAYLYRRNQRYAQSVELSKKDRLYKDAIETAAESKKTDVVEPLLEFFVKEGLKESFSAALYTCYDTIRPDVALELAWRYKILDMAFPYLIQTVREYTAKVDGIVKDTERKKVSEEKKQEQSAFAGPVQTDMYTANTPMIAYYPPGGVDPSMQYGQPGMGGMGGMNNMGGMGGVNMGQPGMGGMGYGMGFQ